MKKIFILLMTSLFLLSGIGVFAQNDRPAVRNRALGSVREVLTARELDGSSEVIERRLERETMRERGQNIPAERQYRILVRKAQQLIGKLPDEDSKNEYIEKLKVIENTRDSIGNKIGRLEGFINELKNIIEDRIIVDKEVTFRGKLSESEVDGYKFEVCSVLLTGNTEGMEEHIGKLICINGVVKQIVSLETRRRVVEVIDYRVIERQKRPVEQEEYRALLLEARRLVSTFIDRQLREQYANLLRTIHTSEQSFEEKIEKLKEVIEEAGKIVSEQEPKPTGM